MRVLFIMRRLRYLPYLRPVFEEIVDRGHELELLLGDRDHSAREQAWLEGMLERPNFSCVVENHFAGDPLRRPAISVRRGSEYMRAFTAEYASREAQHQRKTLGGAPRWVRRLAKRNALDVHWVQAAVRAILTGLDRVMPLPPRAAQFVRRSNADVVAVCDHGRPGSLYSAYVQAAHEAGIPVAICVASWDNLSTRQVTRVQPDRLIVWNETQVREAEELHGLPREIVVTTGAPSFDEWFSRTPREAGPFKERVGLDPKRPYLLWVGGALLPSQRTEAEYVVDWLTALRESGHPLLETIGVMIRPHPLRLDAWLATDFSGFERVVVYPGPEMTMPVGADQRADYFDSIFHSSAVVGINSSAMIEAAIIGRSVLTVTVPEFHESQHGMFHFSYLVEENGGPVRVGSSLDEHFAQLVATLEGRDELLVEQTRRFVQSFVRPRGLDRPATPIFVDELEALATLQVSPVTEPLRVRVPSTAIAILLRIKHLPHVIRLRVLGFKNAMSAR